MAVVTSRAVDTPTPPDPENDVSPDPRTARPRAVREHNCMCPDQPRCVLHGAAEWGGGEPDECQPHGHGALLDEARLARAMTGIVFMDTTSNLRVARLIAKRYDEESR